MTDTNQQAGDPATTIAYQGVPGANSHIACQQAFPDMTPLACATFEDAFAAVESEGKAALAMIPIENSLGGRVADIHHLLPESSLYIIREHYLDVQYQLLATKDATLEGLVEVRSHAQALAQCREQLAQLGVRIAARADTAGSAMEVAELGDPTIGALAPPLAGEIYDLQVLRSRFEDRIGNTTRFVVLSRARRDPDPKDGPCMTSLIFQVRSVPAALYKAMGGFATNGVNITKLESYISGDRFSVARFYAEIEGHPADPAVAQAFEELDYFSKNVRVLGVFPAADYRNQ
ncbi:MAG: prephenate dehydratase [Rhodospirillaceae bacterium]|jgi:prephenate dehydratase|nr:prephenate dehydratase [Rhodospirillaceae bacterium]MBT3931171.1 prephenate dehydratase [Rhodospirillaceae bacterium]MBT4772573.1 prephenate dehydratase [Rhodospirillaceae bacterium]MBT5357958.1 prephenate dehydratase [Rhodospirillaceae bacterium]MBT5768593.1 prephenate dehydratase [Rhodospirillaceae bacterium]